MFLPALLRRSNLGRLGLSLLVGCAVAAGSCSPVRSSAHPEGPTWLNRPSHAMGLSYRRDLLASSRQHGEPYERGRPAIDPTHRRVFVGSSDGGLYAIRAEDGDVLWRFESAGAVQSEPLYDASEDVVYFGCNDGALYKLAAADGTLIWRFSTNAEIARRPELVDGILYLVNANDTIIALRPDTGSKVWSQHRAPALGMEIAGHAGLLLKAGMVYAAFSDGTVTAYDAATGKERWQPVDLSAEAEQTLGEIPKYLDADTTPAWAMIRGSSAVVVGSYEGGVVALDAQTGNHLWSNTAVLGVTDVTVWTQPAYSRPAPGGGASVPWPARRYVIASTGTTGLWALNLEDGTEVWRRDLPDGGTNRPVAVNGALLVSTTEHGLFLVSPRDGAVMDGFRTAVGFSMPPAVYGERAFILSNSGSFMALNVQTPLVP